MTRPKKIDHPLFQLLDEEKIDLFNEQKRLYAASGLLDFKNADLRGLDASGIDFRNSYFRSCDLRGIDFRETLLEGASINRAKISGCYFASDLSAEEIVMSLTAGTRIRCQPK